MTSVGVDELTAEEKGIFWEALERLRGALPGQAMLHTEPVRNPSGVLSEVRAYDSQDPPRRLLAEVPIMAGGVVGRVRVHR